MSLSTLPLSYCTNVHPGRTVEEVAVGLERYTVKVRDRLEGLLAAGLWLARPVVDELLEEPGRMKDLVDGFGLHCYTLNAFPYGDFHSTRVKENVYRPDWTEAARLDYTIDCATVLAELLPGGMEGSISTLPLGFKGFEHRPDFVERAADQLIVAARRLADIQEKTGRLIRLAVEPEPFCLLETTSEAIAFFQLLSHQADRAGATEAVRRHVGLCYDVCHQAVEFEDVPASIAAIDAAGIRINKFHLSCALQLDDPMSNVEGRRALARYAEVRYLHQTMARRADGKVARFVDLSEAFVENPPEEFRDAAAWRIHFHVPVDAEGLGPLSTTRPQLREALAAVKKLSYAPHLEVETYTWEVLPGAGPADLVEGLTRELVATERLIQDLR
jgi:sugar phosphate isomerase/epimerase